MAHGGTGDEDSKHLEEPTAAIAVRQVHLRIFHGCYSPAMTDGPESASQHRGQRLRLLLFIAVSAPLAVALETGFRRLFFPPEFEDVRGMLGPKLETAAWICVGLTAVFSIVGFVLQRRMCSKALRTLTSDELSDRDRKRLDGFGPEKSMSRMVLDKLFLTTSLPQLPALVATLLYMFGASLAPVLVAMLVSSLAVVSQAWSVEHQIVGARGELGS